MTFFHLPQNRTSDSFRTSIQFYAVLLLQSENWQAQIVNSDFHDCFDAKTTTICGKRLCKVSRMSDVVHSCIVHDGDNIEIVFNDTSSYKSSAVNIACFFSKNAA